MRPVVAMLASLVCCSAVAGGPATPPNDRWAQWRGPLSSGVAPGADPPIVWSEERNVRWKTQIPGKGQSTPIVWGDRVYLTTAIPFGEPVDVEHRHADGAHDNVEPSRVQKFVVLALDRGNGSIVWRTTVRSERPHEAAHVTAGWASQSPVTDGKHIFASFGSRGLYALDLAGKVVWQVDLGRMEIFHEHGEGSSPALHGDTIVVNQDHQGASLLIALDKKTGRERWKVARDEITSWSTPLIVEHAGKPQVIVAATRRVRGYDLADGKLIWECGGLSRNVVATPVAANGVVYVGSSYETRALMAIRLEGAKGDLTGTDAVLWKIDRDTPYVPSPLLDDDTLCFIKHLQGFLTCVHAPTGKPIFGPTRLEGLRSVFASPLGAQDRIYIVDRYGAGLVVRRGPQAEVLARNRLDDSFTASPVAVGNELLLRGERHLYCIAEDPTER